MQSLADALIHKPCCALCDPDSFSEFVAADSVLAANQHPDSDHPLVESDSRVLEDRLDLDSELLFAVVAEPEFALLRVDEGMLLGAAPWAKHFAVGPAQGHGIVESVLRVGEENDSLLEGAWSLKSSHEQILY